MYYSKKLIEINNKKKDNNIFMKLLPVCDLELIRLIKLDNVHVTTTIVNLIWPHIYIYIDK